MLPTLFPALRPEGEAFDRWVDQLGAVDIVELSERQLQEGVAPIEAGEKARIAAAAAALEPAWQALSDELGEGPACDALLLGGVLAALHEERTLDPELLELLEGGEAGHPVTALSSSLDPTDLWSVVEAAAAEAACEGIPDELDDEAYERLWESAIVETADLLWSDWHARRLATLVERVRGQLPARGFPRASALLAEGCEDVRKDAHLARSVAAELLGDTLGALRQLELDLAA